MDEKRLARLTEQQRTCLRLVAAGLTSKEIAPRLGIAPGSVDQHLKAAMRILDVGERRTAARLLAEHERGSGDQQLVYQPPEIVGLGGSDIAGPSTGNGGQQHEAPDGRFQEEQVPFLVSPAGRSAVPLPIWGARPHHLNKAVRLGWIVAAAIGIALAFGALVSAIEALVRLSTG
jgi:DNA-binding CsgD family transcriptional regulator